MTPKLSGRSEAIRSGATPFEQGASSLIGSLGRAVFHQVSLWWDGVNTLVGAGLFVALHGVIWSIPTAVLGWLVLKLLGQPAWKPIDMWLAGCWAWAPSAMRAVKAYLAQDCQAEVDRLLWQQKIQRVADGQLEQT